MNQKIKVYWNQITRKRSYYNIITAIEDSESEEEKRMKSNKEVKD